MTCSTFHQPCNFVPLYSSNRATGINLKKMCNKSIWLGRKLKFTCNATECPQFLFALVAVGNARSYSLDLVDQYESLESGGQFRFTPPTHTMLAFRQALRELEAEGGIQGRSQRSAIGSRSNIS